MREESQKCKGARDLLPLDMQCFRKIESIFIKSCQQWDYEEVRTPTLEYLHLFTSAGTLTPAMLNKVYSFLDWDGWSGERVVLRPDGTIPVARLYLENLAKNKQAKLFYVTNVFSFESTGKESRERWQCGVEYLGNDNPLSDIEIIMLASNILKKIGTENIQLKLSHSGLLKSLLSKLGLDSEYYKKLVNALNKGKWDYLLKAKGRNNEISSIISLFLEVEGRSTDYLENVKSLPNLPADVLSSIEQFSTITKLLDSLDFQYEIDITSTENFEYYTGLYFKFIQNNHIVCSGGRYNDLLPIMSGKKIPACGFAIHLDPIIKFIRNVCLEDTYNNISVTLSRTDPDSFRQFFILIQSLTDNGFTVLINAPETSAKCRWNITVNPDAPILTLLDRQRNKLFKRNSINSVLKIMKVET